jgi:hypothetical protein
MTGIIMLTEYLALSKLEIVIYSQQEKAVAIVKAKTKKPAKSAAKKAVRKVTLDDLLAIVADIGKAHEETEKAHKETEKAHKETEKTLKELQKAHKETERVLGRLGIKLGDISEATLLPDLPEKFKQFGFTFQVINRNRKISDDEHGIYTEIDGFLENGSQVMAVEVKTTLRRDEVDYHVERMEKIRKYADLHNDKRQFFGAIAATVIDKDVRRYALKQGFYLIEPSGEDIKIEKPALQKVW